jgi:hypothetical protein
MSHPIYTIFLALLVSGAEALLGRRTARERLSRASYIFTSSIAAVVVSGWFMFLIHR